MYIKLRCQHQHLRRDTVHRCDTFSFRGEEKKTKQMILLLFLTFAVCFEQNTYMYSIYFSKFLSFKNIQLFIHTINRGREYKWEEKRRYFFGFMFTTHAKMATRTSLCGTTLLKWQHLKLNHCFTAVAL